MHEGLTEKDLRDLVNLLKNDYKSGGLEDFMLAHLTRDDLNHKYITGYDKSNHFLTSEKQKAILLLLL